MQETLHELKTAQTHLIAQAKLASLGELTAGIAHELKNPLNFINNFSEMIFSQVKALEQELANDVPNQKNLRGMVADLPELARRIRKNSKRAVRIINGMLAHARGEQGMRCPTQINGVVKEYVALAYHGMRRLDLTEEEYDPALDSILISIVPQDISRAILNIAMNACYELNRKRETMNDEYIPILRVSTKDTGDEVVIRFRDNGDGIPEDVREKIFQPFFSTKPVGEGIGLGLSMACEIITNMHQGSLDVLTQPGEFTGFVIRLPKFATKPGLRGQFRQAIRAGTYRFLFARDGEEGLRILHTHPDIHVVLVDIKMPNMDGLEMLRIIHQDAYTNDRFKVLKAIIMTAYDDMPYIREAMHVGAIDFITKPINVVVLDKAIQNALHEVSRLQEGEQFIGHSAPILKIKEQIQQLADYSVNVLIEGETGTGKSLLAKFIHHSSCRKDGPFVDLHCGALSPALIESELFGHVKGAFTGAERERTGKFQLADGGTLFLDEISTIGPETQSKLLKVIDTKSFFPVGSDEAVQVDVRVIAATNQSLLELVRKNQFREDLYYRLKVVTFSIPPLRARKTDIPLLVNHFLEYFNRRYHTRKTISGNALEKLIHAPWEGNIRDLSNVLENVVVLSPHDEIQEQELPAEDLQANHACPPHSNEPFSIEDWIENLLAQDVNVMQEVQQILLRVAWRYYQGNKTLMAKRLGMARGTLYQLLQKYRIE